MRQLAYLTLLPLLLLSCGDGKGRLRLRGTFQNLDQADFLIFSPNGGLDDIDTLHLLRGKFKKELPVTGGPYTFTIVYPNFSTLSFVASEGDKVRIEGDALALGGVKVMGVDSVITEEDRQRELSRRKEHEQVLRIGSTLPKVDEIEEYRHEGSYLLVGFWANWMGGSSVVNSHIRRALTEYGDQLAALSVSLDIDPQLRSVGENVDSTLRWKAYCDYQGWDSPPVHDLGLDNIPYLLLVDPRGTLLAMGSNFKNDIEPTLQKVLTKRGEE